MRILLVNDDGYKADGINVLRERLLQDGHEVFVMAPSSNRSGASQSINILSAVEVRKISDEIYSCSGSPADCVMTVLKSDIFPRPDIVLSGINHGANIGLDILYSGTCGAARQAVLEGIPSAALSVMIMKDAGEVYWENSCALEYGAMADFAAKNLDNIRRMCVPALGQRMPKERCVFVNINGVARKEPYLGAEFCGIAFREYVNDSVELLQKTDGIFDRKFIGGTSEAKGREYSDWDAAAKGYAAVSRVYAEPGSAGPLDGISFLV